MSGYNKNQNGYGTFFHRSGFCFKSEENFRRQKEIFTERDENPAFIISNDLCDRFFISYCGPDHQEGGKYEKDDPDSCFSQSP